MDEKTEKKRKWILIFIPVCFVMGILELLRAFQGNNRSWLYVAEWPFFGIFIYYMYWKMGQPMPEYDDSENPERESY